MRKKKPMIYLGHPPRKEEMFCFTCGKKNVLLHQIVKVEKEHLLTEVICEECYKKNKKGEKL